MTLRHTKLTRKGETQATPLFARFARWVERQGSTLAYCLIFGVQLRYQEIRLSGVDIDKLLAQTDYVERLRRFRNSVLHYQEDPLSEKHMAFLLAEGSEKWILDLNRAFKAYFERELPIEEWLNKVQQLHLESEPSC
jgi:hypothetical protein